MALLILATQGQVSTIGFIKQTPGSIRAKAQSFRNVAACMFARAILSELGSSKAKSVGSAANIFARRLRSTIRLELA
jgi:hypothetical protein